MKEGLRPTVSISFSLMVHRTELATWLPTLVLCSHGLGIHLYDLNMACCANLCSAMGADL